jgi:hypothetical protein
LNERLGPLQPEPLPDEPASAYVDAEHAQTAFPIAPCKPVVETGDSSPPATVGQGWEHEQTATHDVYTRRRASLRPWDSTEVFIEGPHRLTVRRGGAAFEFSGETVAIPRSREEASGEAGQASVNPSETPPLSEPKSEP